MNEIAQKRAVRNHRLRQSQRGIVRIEVQALNEDRALIRGLARLLIDEGPAAAQTRSLVQQILLGEPAARGGIVRALRRSPLVGADLDLARRREEGRDVEL